MEKVYGSSVRVDSFDTIFAIEFNDCVRDLIYTKEVQELDKYEQHMGTSRYQHCVNVAYFSYFFCKLFHFDYKSAARAGLLHDLYHYDWREFDMPKRTHAFAHPQAALDNSMLITDLNEIEKDAIKNHMWPLSKAMPKHKEAIVVSLADKWCAMYEVGHSMVDKLKQRFSRDTVIGE